MMLVYPEALVVSGRDAGPFTGGAPKGLLHTTEGDNFAGALSVYRDRGFWPHVTCSFERRRFDIWQHLDVTRTAKALEHPAGTAPTNSDHVVQIEIVGRAADAPRFPKEYLDGIGRWMRWIERTAGVIRRPLASFVPGAPRLTAQAWHEGSGWCGHMHVPNNSHTDPGAIDIAYLLNVAVSGPTPLPTPTPTLITPEDTDMRYVSCTDPDSGGSWHCQTSDGGIVTANGSPYLGNLVEHPDWHATGPGHAVQSITAEKDRNGQWGYTIWVLFAADSQLHPYGPFPRDGSLRAK